ncbi:MAG: sugar phosphate nucleotidyltransferase [Bacteroidales bacterium]|nr:sugar phosphate nucleotidyltransferase [Bacteroidales bacterium]
MHTTLLILAAGMGSRYGGMKQVDAFGPGGETITDYSIYDALHGGFEHFVFVISPKMEEDFKTNYLRKFPAHLKIDYVIQSLDNLPGGYRLPEGREKPWGTAHAVLMAKDVIREPFAVVNADDYYGRKSYKIMNHFLKQTSLEAPGNYCMVGFELQKTVSEHGSVARGVCQVNEKGYLTALVERTKIFLKDGGIVFEEEDGTLHQLDPMDTVSMNLFGFTPDFFPHIEEQFRGFLNKNADNPKAELYIPYVVDHLIAAGKAKMSVLQTPESWFGVTYQEDKPTVLKAIRDLVDAGVYPESLWG